MNKNKKDDKFKMLDIREVKAGLYKCPGNTYYIRVVKAFTFPRCVKLKYCFQSKYGGRVSEFKYIRYELKDKLPWSRVTIEDIDRDNIVMDRRLDE